MGRRRSRRSRSRTKSTKSKSRRRSTAASKRRKVRSVAKAKRAANRAAKSSTSTSSSKTKRKPRKIKLNKKDRQRQAQENAKKAFKKKNEQQKKTISASQSRRQVRQKTKEKIATRKKINMPSLSQIGRFTRNLRQPVTALSNMAVNSVLGNPAFATSVASAIANSKYASDYNNPAAPDRSKMTPQQIRHRERMSEKTGVDYFSPRKVVAKFNMSADALAGLGGFKDKGWYKGITGRFPGIKDVRVNKTFYGRDRLKGWHSSQRPGRGQGLKDISSQLPRETRGVPGGMVRDQMGPQQDWLGDLYSSHNISGGKLDQGARDYWTNEAKTKGRDAVMQSIIGTAKAQGTYGGRKKPQRISTGSRRRGGGPIAAAISAGMGLYGSGLRAKQAKQKHRQQAAAAQKSYDLQAKGYKRRQGMIAKTIAATMAARGM